MSFARADFDDFSVVTSTITAATAEKDVLQGPATVTHLHVDNNAGAAVHLKMYDSVAPTVGTTDPTHVFKIASGFDGSISLPDGMEFETGCSFACVQEGGTAGTTVPGGSGVVVALTLKEGVE